MTRRQAATLVRGKAGVLLDVSLGGEPQANAVTFRELGHDPTVVPWPLPSGSVHTAIVRHVLEYVEPARVFAWFDELHRVMRTGGIAYVSGPYGGDDSAGWLSDPTHRTRIVEATFAWLDPAAPPYGLHADAARPTPRPWKTILMARVPGTIGTISYNGVIQALAPDGGKR